MKNPWKRQKTEVKFDNPWITLHDEEVINPGGGISQYGRVHFKNLAIGIIPLDQNMNTWIVGQWRYPLGEYSWEIPMGGGPIGIAPLESARRELREETGISAKNWEELLRIHTSNSVTDEVGFVYVATDLTFGSTDFEESEDLAIKKIPLSEVVSMCMDGRITDSLSLAAVLKLARKLNL